MTQQLWCPPQVRLGSQEALSLVMEVLIKDNPTTELQLQLHRPRKDSTQTPFQVQ